MAARLAAPDTPMPAQPRTDRRRRFGVKAATKGQDLRAYFFPAGFNQLIQRFCFTRQPGAVFGDKLFQQDKVMVFAKQFAELF